MSLEQALQENTAAVLALAEILKGSIAGTPALPVAEAKAAKAAIAKAEGSSKEAVAAKRAAGEPLTAGEAVTALNGHVNEAKAAAPKAEPKAAAPKAEPKAAAPAGDSPVSYDEVKTAGMALAKAKGGPALIATLKTLGVSSARDLEPAQYAAALLALTEAARADEVGDAL